MADLSQEGLQKLSAAENIWISSIRPDGHPHLTPVWFVYYEGKLYISIDPKSVKSRNIAQNPNVVLALEDAIHPVICQGRATPMPQPWPGDLLSVFIQKYEWDLMVEEQYNQLLEITPSKWLTW